MVWRKKAMNVLLISQLFLLSNGQIAGAKVVDSSHEPTQKESDFYQETKLSTPEASQSNSASDSRSDDSADNMYVIEQKGSVSKNSETASSEKEERQLEKARSENMLEKDEVTSSQNRSIEKQTMESGTTADNPIIVETSTELRKAIEVDKLPFIKLAPSSEVFQFEKNSSGRIKISYDVTIDGNGRTLSYSDSGNYYALQASAPNVTIKLKNMTFGSSDYSVQAYDWYGFCYGAGNSNTTIAVENVNYYSNSAAQPFHNTGNGSKIVFSGTNYFSVQRGSYSQEFAESNHFIFEENSHTTVEHDTGQTNSIATSGNDFSFELKSGATVDYKTTSRFISNYSGRGNVIIGNGAALKINGSSDFVNLSRPIDFQVGEQGSLHLSFANAFKFDSNSTFNLVKDSTLDMSVTNGDQIFSTLLTPENFIIDNAYRLAFNVSATNIKEPINAGFTFKDFVDDVTGYGLTADNQPIGTTVATRDTISSNGTNLTLGNTTSGREDFSEDEKATIRGAKKLVLQRLPNPAVILEVTKAIRDTSATFNLSEYLTNQNTINGVTYKLFETKQSTGNSDTELEKKVVKTPITDAVKFENLTSEKEYWLHVQIETGFETGYSEWYEIPFTTKSSVLSVSIPTEMFFTTEMADTDHLNVHSLNYGVKNNSAYPVDMTLSSFSEEGKTGIDLLDTDDPSNKNGLFLQLRKNQESPITLKTDITTIAMGKLAMDEQANLSFSGKYFGSPGKEIDVKYNLTFNFKKAEE